MAHQEICKRCDGDGFLTCEECNGKGKVKAPPRPFQVMFNYAETCESCRGRGKIKCTPCGGKGVRIISDF